MAGRVPFGVVAKVGNKRDSHEYVKTKQCVGWMAGRVPFGAVAKVGNKRDSCQ